MRNLKRALSLALAAMMLIGMMVVSASAAAKDFTDKDEIVNDEAVNTLVTLNVIAGKGDGSYFDPTGIVTRAEMAKMITVVLNGGREPNLGTKLTPSFSDIDGHWAEAYIEYCTSLGIIAGRGNGKFDPNATVTGSEAAKMVLIAMGYSAENSKFVGDSWEINVNATASSKGLYDDMSVVASAPLNRDNAALMVFNGLNAKMVEYDYKLNTVNGNLVTVAIAKDRSVTLLNDKFDLVTKYAYMTDASYNSEKGEYTYTLDTSATMGSAAIPAADAYGKSSYTTELDYTNLFGMKVAVLAKSTDGEVYGLFAEDSKVLGTGVVGDIKDIDGTEFKLGDVKYELTDAAASTPVWDLYSTANAKNLSNVNAAEGPNKYNAVSLIDNTGDGKVDVVVMTPVTPVKVSFSSKTSFTYAPSVDSASTAKYEDVNTGDATFAKGDILLATPKANTVDGKTAFVKAEIVSGKVTAKKSDEYQVNGTWYKKATEDAIALGNNVELAIVNGYFVNVETSTTTTKDLLVVTAKGSNTDLDGNYDAKVVFTDGTISTVKIDNGTVGTLYTYELKDGVYELTEATTTNTGYDAKVTATYDASEEKLTDGTRIADDAVVIVRYNSDSKDVKVISGAELKKWNEDFGTSGTAFANDVNGFSTAQVIVLTATASSLPSTGDEVYGYIVSDPYAGKEDSDYYIYFDMWNGTETVSVKDKVSGTTIAAPYVKGTLVSYTDEGNGVVDGTTAVVTTDGAVVAYDGKIVKIANSSTAVELKITDDTKIYYINTKDVAGVEGGEIAMADEVSTNTYNCNVKYTVANGDEVGVLFVDVNNKVEGSSTVSYGA